MTNYVATPVLENKTLSGSWLTLHLSRYLTKHHYKIAPEGEYPFKLAIIVASKGNLREIIEVRGEGKEILPEETTGTLWKENKEQSGYAVAVSLFHSLINLGRLFLPEKATVSMCLPDTFRCRQILTGFQPYFTEIKSF